jgi:hypothetical protein
MNLKGKIKEIFDTQYVSDRFSKREFVIEFADNPMYPQYIKFELTQDKCDLIDSYKVGDEVDVQFNLRGRAWTNPQGVTQYFNTLQAWRLEPVATNQPAPADLVSVPPGPAPGMPEWQPAEDGKANFGDDDLPF